MQLVDVSIKRRHRKSRRKVFIISFMVLELFSGPMYIHIYRIYASTIFDRLSSQIKTLPAKRRQNYKDGWVSG